MSDNELLERMNLDEDGYPTDEALCSIKNWPYTDVHGLFQAIKSIWRWDDYNTYTDGCDSFEFHTGGWSGNESIVYALEENRMVWALAWQESRRGGHYKFSIPKSLR